MLREYCAHARFVWNLCVEQQSWWRPGRGDAPNWARRSRQLTEARAEFGWLRAVPRVVQEQALRDFEQALRNFFASTHRRPGWRKAGRNEGFRVLDKRGMTARRLSRRVGAVWVPRIGWVRFRWSRAIPEAKSYRITCDRVGRWHIAFAVIPLPIPGPGTGEVVGIDRGVAVSAALSSGELLLAPSLRPGERARLLSLQRKSARQRVRGRPASGRLKRTRKAAAGLIAREADRRKDWAEKASTDIARRFDVIRIEDLQIRNMTRSAKGSVEEPGRNVRQKAGLNREILRSGWGLFAQRLEDKAQDRVEKIKPQYTSLTCNACGHCQEGNRKSQAFLCRKCGHADHADVNAAKNIAAGRAVTARGSSQLGLLNREPQIAA